MENNILPGAQPNPVTPNPAQPTPPPLKDRVHKISSLGIIFTLILAILLINLGHKITYDLNKGLNPRINTVQSVKDKNLSGLTKERSYLSNSVVYYEPSNAGKYLGFKILIHASFIIPIFLLTFLIYYLINVRRKDSNYKVVTYGYLIFSLWMMLYLIGNVVRLAYREFPQLVWYVVIIILVAIFTGLGIFIQKKVNQHKT